MTPERLPSIRCAELSEARGLSFGGVAADYQRGRPGYPVRVVEVAGLPPSAEVLDLAAGTGKLTQLLALHFDRVVAVEPDDALRALIEDAEVLAGKAEEIPLPDGSVDGVFCAEAFHWFDAERASAEIARVLRPGGSLVVCFNEPSGKTEPAWPEEAREIVRRLGRLTSRLEVAILSRRGCGGNRFRRLRSRSCASRLRSTQTSSTRRRRSRICCLSAASRFNPTLSAKRCARSFAMCCRRPPGARHCGQRFG